MHLRSNKAIGYLFAVSSILLAVACFTITASFAIPKPSEPLKKWDVHISSVQNTASLKTTVKDNRIDMNVVLDAQNKLYSISAIVENKGSFDARIDHVSLTDLSNIKVGVGETGRIYYLSDYVELSLKYLKDTQANQVFEGANVSAGDILKQNTSNNILIAIKYKDASELSAEAYQVLMDNARIGETLPELKFTVSVNFDYIENK